MPENVPNLSTKGAPRACASRIAATRSSRVSRLCTDVAEADEAFAIIALSQLRLFEKFSSRRCWARAPTQFRHLIDEVFCSTIKRCARGGGAADRRFRAVNGPGGDLVIARADHAIE